MSEALTLFRRRCMARGMSDGDVADALRVFRRRISEERRNAGRVSDVFCLSRVVLRRRSRWGRFFPRRLSAVLLDVADAVQRDRNAVRRVVFCQELFGRCGSTIADVFVWGRYGLAAPGRYRMVQFGDASAGATQETQMERTRSRWQRGKG